MNHSTKNVHLSSHRHQLTCGNILSQSLKRYSVIEEMEKMKKRRENRNKNIEVKKKFDFEKMISNKKSIIESTPPGKHTSSKNSKIFVCVRKRPIFQKEIENGEIDCITANNPKVCVYDCKMKIDGITKYIDMNEFYFDNVFNENESTESLYECSIKPAIPLLSKGGVVTCFAYGQTGSGKTYTMKGIQDLSIDSIFETFGSDGSFSFYVSFYEIYSGRLYDLLNDRNKLMVLEDKNQKIQIFGLQELEVDSSEEMKKIVEEANTLRTTHNTVTNETSSRSHAICNFIIKQKGYEEEFAKLTLVDLAGSERATETQSNNKSRLAEGAEINKSLLALKECIRGLDARKLHSEQHIPFRTSKLTLILRDSFIPKNDLSKIIMISCISPGNNSSNHTINTLRYSDRLKEKTLHYKSLACEKNNLIKKFNQYSRRNTSQNFDSTNMSLTMTINSNAELSVCDPVPNDDELCNYFKGEKEDDLQELTHNPIPISKPLTFQRKKMSSRVKTKETINKTKTFPIKEKDKNITYVDEVKYINNDKTIGDIQNEIIEEQEFIISSHMNVIKDEVKMLTDEGCLISSVKGINKETILMEEYALRLEKIISKKLQHYKELKMKIRNYNKIVKTEAQQQ